jgi:hypothetical protein
MKKLLTKIAFTLLIIKEVIIITFVNIAVWILFKLNINLPKKKK